MQSGVHLSKKLLCLCIVVVAMSAFVLPSIPRAEAARLVLVPASGSYVAGAIIPVSIFVSSADQSMNAASGVLSFPTELLEVVSVSKTGSIVNLWVQEPSFSNAQGTVRFEGIVLNPGFRGANGRILTVNLRAKAAGTAVLQYASAEVLANDGVGSSILTGTAGARITITTPIEEQPSQTPPPVGEPRGETPDAPVIGSPTHPNEDAWYAEHSPQFTWTLPDTVSAVRTLVDESSDTQPSVVYSPPITEKSVLDLEDGEWYFHLQARNAAGWGEVAHYRVRIDTVPPEISVTENTRRFRTDPTASFVIDASDARSGINSILVSVDDGAFITWEVGRPFETPELPAGRHQLTVRAEDGAGNTAETLVDFDMFTEASGSTANEKRILSFALLIFVLGALALVYALYLATDRRRRTRKRVHEAHRAHAETIRLLREDLEDLKTVVEGRRKSGLTKLEKEAFHQFANDIASSERVIQDELDEIE
jgi:hypothetical protein